MLFAAITALDADVVRTRCDHPNAYYTLVSVVLTAERGANMKIEIHAPSTLVLVVSLALAVLAIIGYFVADAHVAFWIGILAYVIAALGSMVKT